MSHDITIEEQNAPAPYIASGGINGLPLPKGLSSFLLIYHLLPKMEIAVLLIT